MNKEPKYIIDIRFPYNQLKNLIEDYDNIVPEDDELKLTFNKLIKKLNYYPIASQILDDIEDSYTDNIGLDLLKFNEGWVDLLEYCYIENILIKN